MTVSGGTDSSASKSEDGLMEIIDGFLSRKPAEYNMVAINEKIKDKDPYVVVCL